jgi:hypothetical protein
MWFLAMSFLSTSCKMFHFSFLAMSKNRFLAMSFLSNVWHRKCGDRLSVCKFLANLKTLPKDQTNIANMKQKCGWLTKFYFIFNCEVKGFLGKHGIINWQRKSIKGRKTRRPKSCIQTNWCLLAFILHRKQQQYKSPQSFRVCVFVYFKYFA